MENQGATRLKNLPSAPSHYIPMNGKSWCNKVEKSTVGSVPLHSDEWKIMAQQG
jgi:hypothetical protein